MAAMKFSAVRNPKDRWLMDLILLFIPSTAPLETRCLVHARIPSRCTRSIEDHPLGGQGWQGDLRDDVRSALDRRQVFAAPGDVHQGGQRLPDIAAAPQKRQKSEDEDRRPQTRIQTHGFKAIDSGWLQYCWLPAPMTQIVRLDVAPCISTGTATFTCSKPRSPGAAPAYSGTRLRF